jgi:peptidoglycan hydrolase-like protein with peptidoglycan-binding domain
MRRLVVTLAGSIVLCTSGTALAARPRLQPGQRGGSISAGAIAGAPFLVTGSRVTVTGTVAPYIAHQHVIVRFFRDGRETKIAQVPLRAMGHGRGGYTATYDSPRTGGVTATVEHHASPQLAELKAAVPGQVRYIVPQAGFGDRTATVGLLQQALARLHYAVPLSGVYDTATADAVLAYRKQTGLARTQIADRTVFQLLSQGAGAFQVRYPGDGRHVEADLTRQVLAEIDPGGHVYAIYPTSSGKPSTPTVIGRFSVYLKTPGYNSELMYDSNYFIRGYAIHGYDPAPTYAASHGCLRVPIHDAPAIYAWLHVGNSVDVYYENGGGSSNVQSNAGP